MFNNAIDLSRYSYDPQAAAVRKELGLEDKLVVGHIGRFCYQKNHDFLIDIFQLELLTSSGKRPFYF